MPRFTQGELEVMRILWEHGELKPAEIHARFPRNITNPSLRSYLAILLEKGSVVRRRDGKLCTSRSLIIHLSRIFRKLFTDMRRIMDFAPRRVQCLLDGCGPPPDYARPDPLAAVRYYIHRGSFVICARTDDLAGDRHKFPQDGFHLLVRRDTGHQQNSGIAEDLAH